jgi:hypothetical protein
MNQEANDNAHPAEIIGVCASCNRAAALAGTVCKTCVARYGADFARIMGRVRYERVFAVQCFEAISPHQRPLFLLMFGDPRCDTWPVPWAPTTSQRPISGKVIDLLSWRPEHEVP